MLRPRLSVLICLLAAASAGPARAFELQFLDKPLRIDLTETLVAHARPWDPGGVDAVKAYYHDVANRLNVQANWNHFTLGVRVDSNAYFSVPVEGSRLATPRCAIPPPGSSPDIPRPPASCQVTARDLQDRFQTHWFDPRKFFEKTFLSWSNDNVDVTLGDSYANLGRGLVLSLRKVDQLSADTTLLGAKTAFRFGDFSAIALGGVTNIQNTDDLEARYNPDPFDVIVGGRADYRIASKVSVGLEGVWGDQPSGGNAAQRDRHTRVGLVLDAPRPLPWLSIYGEYVRAFETIDTTTQGSALYLSANVLSGITSWLFEFKNYQNFRPWRTSAPNATSTVYAAPPTLERVLVQIIDDSNVVAGRLKTDVRLNPNLTFYLSPEFATVHPALGEHDLLADAYAGAEVRWSEGLSHVFPVVEWRRQWDQTGPLVENLLAFEVDAAQLIGKGWSAEFQGLVWLRDRPEESKPWQEGSAYLGAKWAPRFFAAVGFEFINEQKFLPTAHNFVNAQAQWEFTPSTSITLFVGGRRPGLRCISGVCRNFPPFQGLELSFVARG